MNGMWQRVNGPDLDKNKKDRTKNNQNILKSEHFVDLCEKAGVQATKRQASKYNNKKGAAFKFGKTL